MSTNIVMLVGRTVREPEIRPNESGVKTVLMTLAVNRGKNKDGEQLVDYVPVKGFVAKDAKSNGPYDFIGKGQLFQSKVNFVQDHIQTKTAKWFILTTLSLITAVYH